MSDANMSYLYTIGGYATLFGVGYAIYHVSSTRDAKKKSASIQPKVSRASRPEPRKDDRKKKQRMERFASEAQESSGKASGEKEEATAEPAWLSNAAPNGKRDDGVDNREFAKQLAKAKEGTKFAAKSDGSKQREKSVKQSRANLMTEDKVSTPSSTAGADADDDESPAASPEVGPVDASGVADMLEPAPAAPSILRITDTTSKVQKPKVAKAPEPVETKKQRQNRKKAEAAKAARQEAEKERKVLEEKQRRQARVAEGRPAKDGSQFMAVNGNKSVWTQGTVNGKSTPDADVLHQPLDTFEQPTADKPAPAPRAPKTEDSWVSSLPSEEEQMEMLKDEADEWSTVKTKTSKKTVKKDSSVESGNEAPAPSHPAAPAAKQSSNGPVAPKPVSTKSFGSFSALTSKDEPADDAEEEEWDV